jgi:type IV pilus assembly protein PilC
VLITTVLPAFGNLYAQVGAELPSITRAIVGLGEWLKQNWAIPVCAILGITLAVLVYVRTERGRYQWHGLQLRLPYLGRIIQLTELSRLSRNLALLYRSGLPMTETLPLVIQNVGNVVIADGLARVNEAMVRGEGISQPMAQDAVFLPLLVQMVRVGEETGTLEKTLGVVDQNYDTEAKDRTRGLIGMIQPAMTIFLAIVVGLIALSMVEAMYSIYGQSF